MDNPDNEPFLFWLIMMIIMIGDPIYPPLVANFFQNSRLSGMHFLDGVSVLISGWITGVVLFIVSQIALDVQSRRLKHREDGADAFWLVKLVVVIAHLITIPFVMNVVRIAQG